MREAFGLFEAIANSRWFERSAMILFLNKIDLFREKIESGSAPIRNHFEEYQGDVYDVQQGMDFFAEKFRSFVRQPGKFKRDQLPSRRSVLTNSIQARRLTSISPTPQTLIFSRRRWRQCKT